VQDREKVFLKRDEVLKIFSERKAADSPFELRFQSESGGDCRLLCVARSILNVPEDIERIAKWREQNAIGFPAVFKVTNEGTRVWCQKALLDVADRVLFWVIDSRQNKIGHVGLFRLSANSEHIEIDNIVRGEVSEDRRIMREAIRTMLQWQREVLKIPRSFLRVFANNPSALKLYEELGYKEIQRVPMRKVVSDERTDWQEIVQSPYEAADRYFVTMEQLQK
jgi:RimJ/RimL family protein N-acetyltransferase